MKANHTVDKRNDPIEATKLAAKLMKTNYGMLDPWPLAVTGYNHGPAGVQKLTKLCKSRQLCDLADPRNRRHLGFASRNFFSSFLAVLEAEKNAVKYFGPVFWSKQLPGIYITTQRSVNWNEVLNWFEGDPKVAEIFNPHITTAARTKGLLISKGTILMVPDSKLEIVRVDLAKIPEPQEQKSTRKKKAHKK